MTKWAVYEKDGHYRVGKSRLWGLLGIKWQCYFTASYWRPVNFSTVDQAGAEAADLNYVLDHPEEFRCKGDYWKVVR